MTSTGMDSGAAPQRRRGGWIATGLGALLVLLALGVLAAVALVWPGEQPPDGPVRLPVVAEPEPEAVLAAAGDQAAAPSPQQVNALIDDLVSAPELGGRVYASVVDLDTGGELYGRDADTAAVPASTIKLLTAATVLAARGPDYRIPTTAVAGDEPGEVVLVGGGDPTLALDGDGFFPGAARLDLLASQVLAALGDTPVTTVTVDSSRFSGPVHGPWTSDIPGSGYVGPITALMNDGGRVDPDPRQGTRAADRWEDPDLAAGRAFAEQLGLGADATVARGQAPPAGEQAVLGEVTSPPILRLVEIMLATSDNVVAEALARQVALARDEPASFAGAAAAMTEVLADELGLAGSLAGTDFADGSGLSRDNQVSARLLTDLLVAAAGPQEARLGGLFAGLPVAGWSGTLADRHEQPPPGTEAGLGVVRAKTGSLDGVDTLAGVVVTGEGRLLGFAVLADQVGVDHTSARAALDRIPAALATV